MVNILTTIAVIIIVLNANTINDKSVWDVQLVFTNNDLTRFINILQNVEIVQTKLEEKDIIS